MTHNQSMAIIMVTIIIDDDNDHDDNLWKLPKVTIFTMVRGSKVGEIYGKWKKESLIINISLEMYKKIHFPIKYSMTKYIPG